MTKIVIKIISIVDTTIEKGKKDVCWSFLYYWELCVVIDKQFDVVNGAILYRWWNYSILYTRSNLKKHCAFTKNAFVA